MYLSIFTLIAFLVSTQIAIRYNDLHVLEQFSCSLALSLLSKPENNFLSNETMYVCGQACTFVYTRMVNVCVHFDMCVLHMRRMGVGSKN